MDEKEKYKNFIRLSVLLLDFGKDVLLQVLRNRVGTINAFAKQLNDNKRSLLKKLNYSQKRILFPKHPFTNTVYDKLDFNLICIIIKTLPKSKFTDDVIFKDINILILQKNKLFGNPVCTSVDEKMFNEIWTVSKKTLIALGSELEVEDKLEKKINEIHEINTTDLCHLHKEQRTKKPTLKSYRWTEGRAMFLEISEWLDMSVIFMRTILSKQISQKELVDKINQESYRLTSIKHISYQRRKLLNMGKDTVTQEDEDKESWCKDLDFTSLYLSLRYWGYIPGHANRWGTLPKENDLCLAADLDRLRLVRKKVFVSYHGSDMDIVEYKNLKQKLVSSIMRISNQFEDGHMKETMQELFEESVISEYTQLKQETRKKGQTLLYSASLSPTRSGLYNDTDKFKDRDLEIDEKKSLSTKTEDQLRIQDDINKSDKECIPESMISKALENFKKQNREKITDAFLGHYIDKPDDIFIVAYLKQTATKSKYWNEFENAKVLNIDCMHVSLEAAKVMYSKESIENKIKFQDIQKMSALITENSDSLMKKHTNLQMISGCSVRSRQKKITVETCIVFYCRTKGIIPLGEEEFPLKLGEYNIDVREGKFHWAPGGNRVINPHEYHEPLTMGCNIGLRGSGLKTGSLGGYVNSEDGIGFLTCAHVLYDENKLKNGLAPAESDYVVQPGGGDSVCGRVVKYVFDPNGPVGIDAALVHVISRIPDKGIFAGLYENNMETAGFNPNDKLQYNSGRIRRLSEQDMDRRVIKSGGRTNLTRGGLSFCGCAIKVFDTKMFMDRTSTITYPMKGQIEVKSFGGEAFAQSGDSGSFVFLVEEDQSLTCIGMVEGWTDYFTAIITPITDILQKLDLDTTQLHEF